MNNIRASYLPQNIIIKSDNYLKALFLKLTMDTFSSFLFIWGLDLIRLFFALHFWSSDFLFVTHMKSGFLVVNPAQQNETYNTLLLYLTYTEYLIVFIQNIFPK
jgi:hypothetical protein